MRVVVDTNVLMSAIFFGGPPLRILEAWRRGDIQIVLSTEILEEYMNVSERLSQRYELTEQQTLLALLVQNVELIVAPALPEPVCEDPDDDKFLACAIAGSASVVVSGDKQLLKISGFQNVEILTPRNFVDAYC